MKKYNICLVLGAWCLVLGQAALAQNKAVLKGISTNALTENLVVPSGKTLTINSGASIVNSGTATGFSSALTVGTSTISSGTSGNVLYNNAGTLAELGTSVGSGGASDGGKLAKFGAHGNLILNNTDYAGAGVLQVSNATNNGWCADFTTTGTGGVAINVHALGTGVSAITVDATSGAALGLGLDMGATSAVGIDLSLLGDSQRGVRIQSVGLTPLPCLAITMAEHGTAIDVGSGTWTVSDLGIMQLAASTAPTTAAAGSTAFDTNAWAAGRGAIQIYDGTANTYVVATLASDTPSNGQVPTWNTGGTITWETPSSSGGLTVGSSTITSGTSGRVLYDNSGVLGEMTTSGSGTVLALTAGPSFSGAVSFSGAETISVAGSASTPALLFSGAILSGGTAITNYPHLLIQPSGATTAAGGATTSWSTSGTAIGVNLDTAAGNFLDFKVDGTTRATFSHASALQLFEPTYTSDYMKLDPTAMSLKAYKNALGVSFALNGDDGGHSTAGATLAFGSTGVVTWQSTTRQDSGSVDLTIGRDAAAILQLGVDAATETAQGIKGHDGSGTDKDGADLNLGGGASTGTGRGGDVAVHTTLTGTTGSSANSYSTRAYYAAKPVTLTESTATTVATIAVAAAKIVGLRLSCTVTANDGTDYQSLTSEVTVDAVNKAGTVTATIQDTPNSGGAAVSAGTLTCTYTAVASGNTVLIKANAVSSLTQTTLQAKWNIVSLNSTGSDTTLTTGSLVTPP